MAKRNRKKQQKDGFMIFRPIGSVIVAMTLVALAYVWLGCRCEALGKEIQSLERSRAELNKKCRVEEYRWSQIQSPANIERALRGQENRMDWPNSGQIVHLPVSMLPTEPLDRDYLADAKFGAGRDRMTRHD